MAMVPLQAAFHGDFLVQLIPVDDEDDMATVAAKIAHHAVNLRVAERNLPMAVWFNDRQLPASMKFSESGIGPMDYVEAGYVE
ncbi:toluene-4-monooxygenase system B family protein [Rhizobium sp. C1]|uniref:toluene-4-monooxygenase system B family protein n=1 Tax=Rhizobium sp. C1 TaxID=1349799 RepID=UPI000BDDA0CD|nr:toluene-4-monooxygenase system B family protein [Rhizobium sp. C1]MCD2178691.1 toluene-4-monooxygenase system B family protein [Rhizobium sp. C1]SOC82626.1 toluene monooxygenase system protein B [Ensifer adhaerens]HZG28857.1 toluene-4-monooxygenase system B family protein [Ensifer sp.]